MLISVVLPAYNVQDTIGESIDSILSQTFTDFELIIINDGSQDNTEEVIHAYSDKRIRYYRNEKNEGLIYTLNRGLDLAQGKYIARMDADDVSLPTRFEKQVKVMEESPNIVVCGTQIILFGVDTAKRFTLFLPEESEDLKNLLFIQTCFAHPTVMVRRQVLIDNEVRYDADYPHAEDYKMWIDLVIDTPSQGVGRSRDGFLIRRYAIETGVTCLTSLDTADALLTSLETGNRDQLSVVDIAQI